MRLSDCHNISDLRSLARRRLPWPVFDYIDGAADDELTKARNTAAYDEVDLVPNVLAGVGTIDTRCTIMGRESALPLVLSPTALQRVFHWQGERAVARAAEKFGLWFGISSLATVSIEEIAALVSTTKMFQLYVHKDKGLNTSMIQRCQSAGFDAIALTVDTIVSGKRERCQRSGFTTPPRFTPSAVWSYATRPRWALDYMLREKFRLPNLDTHVAEGTGKGLAWHLLSDRVLRTSGAHTHEDGRYLELREKMGPRINRFLFWFFQAQAVSVALLAGVFALGAAATASGPTWLDYAGAGLWLVGLCGETIADEQLKAFKRDPASKGRTCRRGLWRYSRHPNYFFEWLMWCSFAVVALNHGWGWLGVLAPLTILVLVLKVTGIPPTEKRALRTRGEDYRRYQRETSAFFPWFPREVAP
ncbi:alpha-hydroxy-acid oxidizing protein [Leptolyngbya sp. 15MV]|nr:alpha-hydroxy-acid oxidizing protein [Leptolyngbya sp. 15MV]